MLRPFALQRNRYNCGMTNRRMWLLVAFLLAGCAVARPSPAEGVAIYLPAQQLSGSQVLEAVLDGIALQPQPIIAENEIVSYTASTHDLVLVAPAMERLAALKVPVNGRGFVVCVNRGPIFAGAFWVLWSSLSFDGITIDLPLDASDGRVRLYSGYPMQDASSPTDPRDDARLLEAFRRAGKLR
jgi:hypothetical protein